jgi:hypothetical protein
MLPRSDPPILVRAAFLNNKGGQKDLFLRGLELRKRLPDYLKDRSAVLVNALSPFLPSVLQHITIKLDDNSLSTAEMWEIFDLETRSQLF